MRRHASVLAALTLLGPPLLASRPASAAVPAVCASPRASLAYIVGSVWADGGFADTGGARMRTSSRPWAESLLAAARCARTPAEDRVRQAVHHLHFPDLHRPEVPLASVPPVLAATPRDHFALEAFIAAVLQAEGGRTTGLVLDDPDPRHVAVAALVLDRLGMPTVTRRQGHHLHVPRAHWADFAHYPIVVWDRVPGYGITFTV